ncbi:multidrug resistance-associated protein 4-like [Anneissia japonica]|uniref:multidrug resistance-associated protein 4-like n=1 Tax=Anneissia japonica TaxID=1529436 RepID=UPI001425A311|nr:multidrug resistance-associated protein 4-like [Anneissia japonica]
MYFTVDSGITTNEAYMYATIIVLLGAAAITVNHHFFLYSSLSGMRMRVAFCGLIYRKALRLSSTALGQTTVGQVVNMLSNDVSRFDQELCYVNYIWLAPLQLLVVTVLLWYQLGPSCFAGTSILLLMVLLQAWFGTLFSIFRAKTAMLTDERIRIMNEIIAGMRVIKMYAWEKPFCHLVSECRRREIGEIRKSSLLRGSIIALFFVTTTLVSFATFAVYSLTGNTLTASKVYLAMPLYNVLRQSLVLFFPYGIMMTTESFVSFRRIRTFLMLEELQQAAIGGQRINTRPKPQDVEVTIEDLSASWDQANSEMSMRLVLKNINFKVKSGELLAVVGPVGCGKTSLLMAILGEVPYMTGKVNLSGRLAYASQLPWVLSGTIRDNILFGKPYNKQQFEHVIEACALKTDLKHLPKKDLTLVGERGVTLSGGQRARIGLARAVYNDMELYLLDDPLSAVDTQVGRHLFDVCIRKGLKDKPCILVTHQLQYLESVDKVLVMKDGQVAGYGTYDELRSSGIDFNVFLKKRETIGDDTISSSIHDSTCGLMAESIFSSQRSLKSKNSMCTEPAEEEETTVYNGSDWWLSYWVYKEETTQDIDFSNSTDDSMTMYMIDSNWYIYIFCGLIAVLFVTSFLRSFMTFILATDASKNLHNQMFHAIVHAPIRFFDTNPIGRILNRFARDIGFMDDLLPITVAEIVQIALRVFGIIITISIFNPVVFIFVVPIGFIFILVRMYYLSTSRDVKRIEGIARSPVFSHLSATLQGISTVRAFQVQRPFIDQFEGYQDTHTQAWYMFLTTSTYFGFWLDWLSLVFIVVVTYGSIIRSDVSESINSGSVGLSLSYALSLMIDFQWGVRQSAEMENLMTSTERVLEYTDIESEAPLEYDFKPTSDWPRYGFISFENVSLCYFNGGPTVLKELSCCIQAQEKVGVAGRTGAGKSSLMTALLRLAEPTGKVTIDGVLTSNLGLHDLRKSISVIPQEPVLFSGSLRRNLDPFGDHNDLDLWKALEEVQLKSKCLEFPDKLEAAVLEGGTNFSVGERQLLCLARAMLRNARILIVDEATANVDIKTDTLIQAKIRQRFKHCTVLTIAHRLKTIMDSDRILILEQGKCVEFDEPFVLLQKRDGFLAQMVAESGQTEAAKLLAIAKEKYYRKKSNISNELSGKNCSTSALTKLIPKGVNNLTIETNL